MIITPPSMLAITPRGGDAGADPGREAGISGDLDGVCDQESVTMRDVDGSIERAIAAAEKLRDTDHSVTVKTDHSKQVGEMPTFSWSSRIPAAIAKAEAELDGADSVSVQRQQIGMDTVVFTITATEVALAKALWDWHLEWGGREGLSPAATHPSQALRDFTEKVESL